MLVTIKYMNRIGHHCCVKVAVDTLQNGPQSTHSGLRLRLLSPPRQAANLSKPFLHRERCVSGGQPISCRKERFLPTGIRSGQATVHCIWGRKHRHDRKDIATQSAGRIARHKWDCISKSHCIVVKRVLHSYHCYHCSRVRQLLLHELLIAEPAVKLKPRSGMQQVIELALHNRHTRTHRGTQLAVLGIEDKPAAFDVCVIFTSYLKRSGINKNLCRKGIMTQIQPRVMKVAITVLHHGGMSFRQQVSSELLSWRDLDMNKETCPWKCMASLWQKMDVTKTCNKQQREKKRRQRGEQMYIEWLIHITLSQQGRTTRNGHLHDSSAVPGPTLPFTEVVLLLPQL